MNTAVANTANYQSLYRSKSKANSKLICSFFLLASVISFRVYIGLETTSLGYKLTNERKIQVNFDMQRRDLELQKSLLMRPDNIVARAKADLGLDSLKPEQARRILY